MSYSGTALLALGVHCIIHFNVIRNTHYHSEMPVAKAYRGLILSILSFCIFDSLWGVLYDAHLLGAAALDTTLYFCAMAASVFFWTRFVTLYLGGKTRFLSFVSWAGWLLLGFFAVVLTANLFLPVMFWFDGEGVYHAGSLRYLALSVQILLFLSASLYVFFKIEKRTEARVKLRYAAIGSFGITMSVMVVLQTVYPLLPLYAIGCLLGGCILHTFVLSDIKDSRRLELEEALRRVKEQEDALGSARLLAYTDALTGVKSSHAYVEAEKKVDRRITCGELEEFGIMVFDVNGLKQVNDRQGHDAGDHLIQNACRLICRVFTHSPVFRIGGDEFVALLEGQDYFNREALRASFEAQIDANLKQGDVVVASGLAVFRPGQDNSYRRVFERADQRMYDRKSSLKSRQG